MQPTNMLFFCILLVLMNLSNVISCPNQKELYPCVCNPDLRRITCSDVETAQVLQDAVYALRYMTRINSFIIENGNFAYLPHNIFSGLKFTELNIKSCTFSALTDTDFALEGLEEEITTLMITDSEVLSEWDWTVFSKLSRLSRIHVDVNLEVITRDIKEINSINLKIINFDKNKITAIDDTAFNSFHSIEDISVSYNLLSVMKRSMIPEPANYLKKLDLSQNKIQQLPADMFVEMPSLEILDLSSNMLLSLDEGTFAKVWENLSNFNASGNHIRCDCRLSWMLQLKFPESTTGDCDQPIHLRGKSLKDVNEVDLWCFL